MPVSTAGQEAFARAYAHAVSRWPVPVTQRDVPTGFGRAHVLESGKPDGPPALLLPGSGATATAWAAVAGELAPRYRVLAADPPGQPSLNAGGRALREPADAGAWLGGLLDGLGAERALLAGHSYGAWLALCAALHAPDRVSHLALLDPTSVFAPLALPYLRRGVPVLLRPSTRRTLRFLRWETGGRELDPDWLAVAGAAAALGRPVILPPRRARGAALAGLRIPVLVAVAGRSRAHDPARVAAAALRLIPGVTVQTLAPASHHSIPAADATQLARYLDGLAGGSAGRSAAGRPAGGA